MDQPAGVIATAAGIFAGTNIDDLLVLTVLFLSARATGRPAAWHIWVGQYVGIALLVAASAAAAAGLSVLPDRWVGLLGLIPLALGVYGLVAAARGGDDDPIRIGGFGAVVAVTLANGADNLAVYVPVFRTMGVRAGAVTVAVFAVGVAMMCLAASLIGSHKRLVALMERSGRWIVPAVFVIIGVAVLVESWPG
jgi:cadmium resistance protein CadD (predicted permease)